MIRKTLKAAYPSVSFRVRSDGFSGGDSVDVERRIRQQFSADEYRAIEIRAEARAMGNAA